MNKQLVFIYKANSFERDYERLGAKYFVEKGYSLKLFFIGNNDAKNYNFLPQKTEIAYLDEKRLLKELKKLNNKTLVIRYITYDAFLDHKIKRILNINNINVIDFNLAPNIEFTVHSAKNNLSVYFYINYLRKLKNKSYNLALLVYKTFFPCYSNYIFTSHRPMLETEVKTVNYKTKIVGCNSLDYSSWISRSNKKLSNEFILFLDDNLFNSKDDVLRGFNYSKLSKAYYTKLEKFFKYLEKITGFEVVIAGHPRVPMESLKKRFHNRKIYIGKTVDLVSRSDFCIQSISTSINFAAFAKKPFINVVSNETKKTLFHNAIKTWANKFSMPICKLEDYQNIKEWVLNRKDLSPNYDEFILNYNKCSEIDDELTYDTVYRFINNKDF